MPSYLQKGPTFSLPANKTTQTNVAFGLGNGLDVDFTVTPPTGFSYVYVNTIYRTDWQGTVALSPSARTNYLLHSDDFESSWWGKTTAGIAAAPIVTTGFTGPDGQLTARRVQFNLNNGTTSNDISQLTANSIMISGQAVLSYWIKSNDSNNYVFTFTTPADAGQEITVTPVWQRIVFAEATSGTVMPRIRLRGNEATSKTADILICKGQLEPGSTATSPIPTTTAPVTITDYTVSGLTYTLAEIPLTGAIISYSGYSYTAAYATFDLPSCGSISISPSGLTSGKLRITASVDGINFNPAVILPIDGATGAFAASSDLPNGFYTLNVKPFKSIRFTQTDITDTVTISTALGR